MRLLLDLHAALPLGSAVGLCLTVIAQSGFAATPPDVRNGCPSGLRSMIRGAMPEFAGEYWGVRPGNEVHQLPWGIATNAHRAA